jgi:demethylmenaquinone methyltransferase/2-methoxy-6-polyprenyl-1,4-benzoquinol methylase
MTGELLAEQVAYYRARADEYDDGAYPDRRHAQDRIAATVAGLAIGGSVLELACGTGMWTAELARRAAVTAVDTAPETLAVARRRCPPGVRFVVGDAFEWRATERFDVVFFAFWLSHVPAERVDAFLARAGSFVRPGGRLVIVDEPAGQEGHERMTGPDIASRTLADGRAFRIVKRFLDPADLAVRLSRAGRRAEVSRRGDWFVAQATNG